MPESQTAATAAESGLLDRTRALLPLLRENAQRTEDLRRVADENIEALTDAGVFRMTVGRHFGGYESSLDTQYDVLAEIAGGMPVDRLGRDDPHGDDLEHGHVPRQAQDEVFADPRVRVASVFAAGGLGASRRRTASSSADAGRSTPAATTRSGRS